MANAEEPPGSADIRSRLNARRRAKKPVVGALRRLLVYAALLAIGVAVGVFVLAPKGQTSGGREAEKVVSALPPAENPIESITKAEQEAATSLQRQRLALAKERRESILSLGDAAAKAAKSWADEALRWEKEVIPLLTSDQGKLIASDAERTRSFRLTLEKSRPTPEQALAAARAVDRLTTPLKTAQASDGDISIPPEELAQELSRILEQAKAAGDAFRTQREAMDVLISAAKDAEKPAEKTLQATIEEQKHQDAAEQNRLIVERTEKARREGDLKIAEEKAKAIEGEKMREAAGIRDREAANQAKAKADQSARVAQAKKDVLRKKARSPEVQRMLAPFFARGSTQPSLLIPGEAVYYKNGKGLDAPVSLVALKAVGALEPTNKGIMALMQAGTNQFNDRAEKWPFVLDTYGRVTQENSRYVKAAQDLLVELGDVLVEERLLSP